MRRYQPSVSLHLIRESSLRLHRRNFSQTNKRVTSAFHPKASYVNYYKMAFFGFSFATFFYQSQSFFQNTSLFACFCKTYCEAYLGTKYRTHPFESWDALVRELIDDCEAAIALTPSEEKSLKDALYAMRCVDHSQFIAYLKAHDSFIKVHPFLFNALGDIAALLGKVSVLRVLENINPSLMSFHSFAQRLLRHPRANDIERLGNQVVTGPGNMKFDGANALLNTFYRRDLDEAYADFLEKEIGNIHGDDYCFSQHLCAYTKKLDEIHKRYSPENLVFFCDYMNDRGCDRDKLHRDFKNQLLLLKEKLVAGSHSVTVSFLIEMGHFACGQIALHRDDNGTISGEMVVIDGLGAGSGVQRHESMYFIFSHFCAGNAALYVSEELIQRTTFGCSIVAQQQLDMLLHTSHYVPGGDLFAYLRRNKTDYRDLCFYDYGSSRYTDHLKVTTARLPAAFCSLKQVLSDKRLEEVVFRIDPRAVGNADMNDFTVLESVSVRGQGSLLSDLKNRKEEYELSVLNHTKTLEEKAVASLAVKAGKLINPGIDYFAFTEGVRLVRDLGLFGTQIDYRFSAKKPVFQVPSESTCVRKY